MTANADIAHGDGERRHLPECPAPLCDWGDPSAECMGYEDCHHLCCCDALRACEQRVLDAAREAVIGTCGHTKYEGCSPCSHDDAVAAIEALRNGQEAEDLPGNEQPDTSLADHPSGDGSARTA